MKNWNTQDDGIVLFRTLAWPERKAGRSWLLCVEASFFLDFLVLFYPRKNEHKPSRFIEIPYQVRDDNRK
jgi:hypothetical protein